MADRRRRLLIAGVALTVVAGAIGVVAATRATPVITGRVVDMSGRPIAGARVAMAKDVTTADGSGTFMLRTAAREGWIRADATGYLPRLRPAATGRDVLLRLTPDDGHTISLVFGGDVMFGRRFFDPNEDGDVRDGLLGAASSAADHARLLAGVEPALAAADLSVVNLETPLVAAPFVNPTASRPPAFHPAKEFVFGSLPFAASGLRLAGVDVVGIGNNHLFDALELGVRETLASLDGAGYPAGSGRAGGGSTEVDAWAPAIAEVRGTTVAVIACTTIDGHETPPIYVALGPAKGGAAACSDEAISGAVRAARAHADVVVMMIHGGYEYDRTPTPRIRHLSAVAQAAGASLVVNHHPHVVGGFDWSGGDLTAWTIGNLLFDQTVWPTFESYVLTVHVRDGKAIRAMVDPLIVDGFRPRPLVGELADHVARDAAGWAPGTFVVEDGSVELGGGASVVTERRAERVTGVASGSIVRLPGAASLEPATVVGELEAGRDLLWTGGFEDGAVDGENAGGLLWLADGEGRMRLRDAAASGELGVRLDRTGASDGDVILSPTHRVPVEAGTRMSLLASYRLTGSGAPPRVQLSWFNDLRGVSSVQSVVDLPGGDGWQRLRLDVTVPANAVAVLPILRLGPPAAGRASLDVDDVQLIAWGPAAAATLATDYLRIHGSASFSCVRLSLPGSGQSFGEPVTIWAGDTAPVASPGDLPPGPSPNPLGDD